jgi:predicted amidophosphoribosyltransferase
MRESSSRDVPSTLRGIGRLWASFADLVAPALCGGCERPLLRVASAGLCEGCRDELAHEPRRVALARPPRGLPPVYVTAPYAGGVRGAIVAHKEHARFDLARPLGMALARAAEALLDALLDHERVGPDRGTRLLLVPVPSTRAAVRRRGHDPLASLGLRVAGILRSAGHDVEFLPVLRHRRAVSDQAGLDRAARLRNLGGALAVPARHARRVVSAAPRVVLLDDIVTTGASLAEAARAIRAVGARVSGAAAIAATRPGRRAT